MTFIGNGTNANTVLIASSDIALANQGVFALNGTRLFTIGNGAATVDLTVVPALVNGIGVGGLAKAGLGTLALSGVNTYTGPTAVNDGQLLVSGSLSGSSAVSVNSGGTIGGTGSIAGPTAVNVGASILGGDGATAGEDLAVSGDLTLSDGSFIKLTLGAAGAHSTLARTGGVWTFDLDQAFSFINAGVSVGTFDNIITGLTVDPGTTAWTITNFGYVGSFAFDGSNVDLTLTAVPEPSSLFCLATGAGMLLGLRRRRASLILN